MSGGPIDFAYLESFTAGDRQVIAEVLAIFQDQAAGWLPRLEAPDDGWRDLAHTIKGSAKGIGANALGELAAEAEFGDPSLAPGLAPGLAAALREALAAIESYLA